jgi:hypothetical protein
MSTYSKIHCRDMRHTKTNVRSPLTKNHISELKEISPMEKKGGGAAAVGDLGAGAKVCIKYFSTSKASKHTCFSPASSSSSSL